MSELARVVAVMNGKGGVGKTSLAGNVGALTADAGYRVLLVDLDPQGNLAEELGYVGTPVDDGGEALAAAMAFSGQPMPQAVRTNLDVLPGGEYLEDLENVLGTRSDRSSRRADAHTALARCLAGVAGEYDLVLLDCPPGSPALQTAALGAARWLVIPTRTDDSSRKGLLKALSGGTCSEPLVSTHPDRQGNATRTLTQDTPRSYRDDLPRLARMNLNTQPGPTSGGLSPGSWFIDWPMANATQRIGRARRLEPALQADPVRHRTARSQESVVTRSETVSTCVCSS